jgi:2-keto-4-pentenoate hydratase/2-oxohepta-3-ene-1,7-dioic acid hydratase in catechol pathway
MRLVTYHSPSGPTPGVLLAEEIVPASSAAEAAGLGDGFASVRELLARHGADDLQRLGAAAHSVAERIPLTGVSLGAPVPDPDKIVCLALNYRDHAQESGNEIPERPSWFAKFATSLIGPGDAIVLPAAHADYVDYEAELAVVMGSVAKEVTAAYALGCIAGAMPFNDVSARDLQLQNPLWTSGKAVDTFGPCGPALVTLDEIDDLQNLGLRTRLNGEIVQEGNTRDQIFDVAMVIAWLSRTLTLVPGDIIATGTPAGIGALKGVFLRDGDTVEVEVEGLGAVANPVRAASPGPSRQPVPSSTAGASAS